ncbi:hypothetical protein V1511DRAFT_512386 [Dipodascopsis uninucleata]
MSLSSLDFSRHENFTNVVLQRKDVTSLIRDVDKDEAKLLTVDLSDNKVVLRNQKVARSVSMTDINRVVMPVRQHLEDNTDLDIDGICNHLDQLIRLYPSADEIRDRVNFFRERGQTLKEAIEEANTLVEQQKTSLDSLHLVTNNPYGIDCVPMPGDTIPWSMVKAEEAYIKSLEDEIEAKQKEISCLDQRLQSNR